MFLLKYFRKMIKMGIKFCMKRKKYLKATKITHMNKLDNTDTKTKFFLKKTKCFKIQKQNVRNTVQTMH